jgi:branched-chain amino acid transport system permease protein
VLVGLLSSVVSVVLSPATAPFVLFSAIVLALILRPQGLFTMAGAQR